MLPHEIPELKAYPAVHDFVENHLSMQFGDVRAMLRLPLPEKGITNGCNFAAAFDLSLSSPHPRLPPVEQIRH